MKDFREQNFYELLDVSPHASQQELELSYQRARRVFSSDSVATYALFQPAELNLLRRRIEEAFRVLSNPERRTIYDREILTLGHEWADETVEESDMGINAAPEAPLVLQRAPAEAVPQVVSSKARHDEETAGETQQIDIEPEAEVDTASAVSISNPNDAASLHAIAGEASLRDLSSADLSMPAREPPRPTGESVSTTISFPASSPPSLSTRSRSNPPPLPKTPAVAPAAPAAPPRPPMPEINETTEYTGALLAQVRQARGMTLERLTEITKINIFYLRAFENDKFSDLPAEVYIRGYLRHITSLLGLDPQRVIPSYLARMKKDGA